DRERCDVVRLAQHDGVMVALLDAAQIERVTVLVGNNVAEAIHIERARAQDVGDAELDVARAHDVERRIEHGIAEGHLVPLASSPRKRGPITTAGVYGSRLSLRWAGMTSGVSGTDLRNLVIVQRDRDVLRLHVEVERIVAAVAADARRLHPAELRRPWAHSLRIDPHHSGLDALREPMAAADTLGPQIRRE